MIRAAGWDKGSGRVEADRLIVDHVHGRAVDRAVKATGTSQVHWKFFAVIHTVQWGRLPAAIRHRPFISLTVDPVLEQTTLGELFAIPFGVGTVAAKSPGGIAGRGPGMALEVI
jgi:hypothetical protein